MADTKASNGTRFTLLNFLLQTVEQKVCCEMSPTGMPLVCAFEMIVESTTLISARAAHSSVVNVPYGQLTAIEEE